MLKGDDHRAVAAARVVLRDLEQLASLAATGRAPALTRDALTPLPPEVLARLEPHLAALRRGAERTVHGAEPPEPRPVAATLRWAALLLDRVREHAAEDPRALPEGGEAHIAAMLAILADEEGRNSRATPSV